MCIVPPASQRHPLTLINDTLTPTGQEFLQNGFPRLDCARAGTYKHVYRSVFPTLSDVVRLASRIAWRFHQPALRHDIPGKLHSCPELNLHNE